MQCAGPPTELGNVWLCHYFMTIVFSLQIPRRAQWRADCMTV